jgi:hypothetical protein
MGREVEHFPEEVLGAQIVLKNLKEATAPLDIRNDNRLAGLTG